RTRAGGAPRRGARAERAVAAGAGALAHVADTAGAFEEHGSDIRRAAARRTIRTRGDAGADRRLRALAHGPSAGLAGAIDPGGRIRTGGEAPLRGKRHGRDSVGL